MGLPDQRVILTNLTPESPKLPISGLSFLTGMPSRRAWSNINCMENNSGNPIFRRRAELMVRLACELLGVTDPPQGAVLRLRMKVHEFELLLKQRYGDAHPELVFRSDSALERARLDREVWPQIPKVVLQQGAPVGAKRRLASGGSAAPG